MRSLRLLPVAALALVALGCAAKEGENEEPAMSESNVNGEVVAAQIVGALSYGDNITVPYPGHRAAMRLRVNAHDVVRLTLTAGSGARIDTKILRETSPGKLVTILSPDATDVRTYFAPSGHSFAQVSADTFEDVVVSFELLHHSGPDTISIAVTSDGSLPSMTLAAGPAATFVAPPGSRSCYQTVELDCDERTSHWVTRSPGPEWTATDNGSFRKRTQASVGIGVSEHAVKWYHARGIYFGPPSTSEMTKTRYALTTVNGSRLTLLLLDGGAVRVEASSIVGLMTCVGTLVPSASNASANPPDPCPDM